MKIALFVSLIACCSSFADVLVVGDSFAKRFGETSLAEGATIDFRNHEGQYGDVLKRGGTLRAIGEAELDFSGYELVIVMAGWHDRHYEWKGKEERRELFEKIRRGQDNVIWVDTWEWAERGKAEGFAVDKTGHIGEEGYRIMFDELFDELSGCERSTAQQPQSTPE